MSSNMYPYNRPTEGGILNVTENGSVSLAGTNYSEINVNVSGGGSVGAGVGIFVKKTGVDADLGFMVGDASGAHLTVQTVVDTFVFVPSGIEYLLLSPNDGTDWYEFSDGNVSATVETNGTETPFTDFAVVDITMGGQTTKAVKFTPPVPSEGAEVAYTFTITA